MRPKIGIHPNVPWEIYSSWDALRSSYLKHFRRSPAHAHASALGFDTETRAKDLGQALHCAILEPERFAGEYVKGLAIDRRSNANKARWAEFEAENAGKGVLTEHDWQLVSQVRDSIWRHSWAASLLGGVGSDELSAVWEDSEFHALCKARIDRFSPAAGAIVDLKSCRDASKGTFGRAIANYDYHVQAAFYLDGLDAISPYPRRFIWVAFEKDPPFAAALYEPDPEALEEGRRRYKHAIAQHLECTRTGNWPDYPQIPSLISLPPWAKTSNLEDSDDVF